MQAADVPAFSAYLRKHVTRLPPDLLWQEWTSNWAKARTVTSPHPPPPPRTHITCLLALRQSPTSPCNISGSQDEGRCPFVVCCPQGKWAESQGEKRPLVVYRYNMLKHIGDVSSFAVRPEVLTQLLFLPVSLA